MTATHQRSERQSVVGRAMFAVRRPWLLLKGLRTDRHDPDVVALAGIDDAEQFVWAVLPHAARSFATSILMLPARQARAAAVAYLYCRMLDTYEDLSERGDTRRTLERFAERMETLGPPPDADLTPASRADEVHVLLVERCDMVDEVFRTLPVDDQIRIVDLVTAMSQGMLWSTDRFAEQGGVLVDGTQLRQYCHHVIGEPVVFALALVTDEVPVGESRSDALAVSELIQLANVTRDIEADLARGVGYDAALRPLLGTSGDAATIRDVRRRMMATALTSAPAYRRLFARVTTRRFSLARASAVLMLLHTHAYYARCADMAGVESWRAAGRLTALGSAMLAGVSRRWTAHVMERTEADFGAAVHAIEGAGPG